MAFVPGYGNGGGGGVSAIIPGNGMTVSGPNSTPTITNNGVLSVNGETGNTKTKMSQLYKTSSQNLVIGNNLITWDAECDWAFGNCFTFTAGQSLITCIEEGVYQFTLNINIDGNGSIYNDCQQVAISFSRPDPESSQSYLTTVYPNTAGPSYWGACVPCYIALQPGDTLEVSIFGPYIGGPPNVVGGINAPFGLGSGLTWQKIRPALLT